MPAQKTMSPLSKAAMIAMLFAVSACADVSDSATPEADAEGKEPSSFHAILNDMKVGGDADYSEYHFTLLNKYRAGSGRICANLRVKDKEGDTQERLACREPNNPESWEWVKGW